MWPCVFASTGLVNTSPSGKFSWPSALIHFRPPTSTVRSVSSATIRSSRTDESRSQTSAWRADTARQCATGSGSSRCAALYTNCS